MSAELTLWTMACVTFGGWAGMLLTWMWLDRPRLGGPQGGERLPDNVTILARPARRKVA